MRSPYVFVSAAFLPALVACPVPDFPAPEELVCGIEETVVTFATVDGVDLVADYRPAANADRGAVVLFHMDPRNNDRTGYPTAVREAFGDRVSVLNVDRRGAGDSGGRAEEAAQGAMARWDMEAATRFLGAADRACPVDSRAVVLIGAGDGTTPVFDYVVRREAELPEPAGLVWISPGTHTEANNRVLDNRELLESFPMLWLYPTNEPYSDQWTDDAPPRWTFHRDGEQHGTDMFDGGTLEESTIERLVDFSGRWAD